MGGALLTSLSIKYSLWDVISDWAEREDARVEPASDPLLLYGSFVESVFCMAKGATCRLDRMGRLLCDAMAVGCEEP